MKIDYDHDTHRYWIDGAPVPSITQSLRCLAYDEFDFVEEAKLRAKADQGTSLAKAIEDFCRHDVDLDRYDPDVLDDFDAFVEWHRSSKAKIIHCETIVGSKRWGFAGRLDMVAELPGVSGLCMIDNKRTYNPPATGGPQTAAQEIAFRETFGYGGEMHRYLLHFKDGVSTLIPQRERSDEKTFLAALTVTKQRIRYGHRY